MIGFSFFCRLLCIFAAMLVQSQAIVLHAIKYGDGKMIVDLFTRSDGRQSFIVPMPKSAKSKVKKQYFQSLTLLEVTWDMRPNVQLQKLRDVRVLMPYTTIPFHPDKLTITLFLGEFLYHALKGEQQDEALFDYILNSLEWLDGCSGVFANFHLVFLMRLSRFLGFYPNLEAYEDGDYFDLRQSCFCGESPFHHDYLEPLDARRLIQMMRMDFPTMYLFQLSHHDRNRLLEVAVTYYRLHLPDFPELKSLAVLQAVYE